MLRCKDVSERASALIDGELTLWEMVQIRLHLAVCKGCAAFVQQMRVTRGLTAITPFAEPEDTAAMSAILARLRDEQPR